jgi:hypothetical protein
MKRQSDPMQWRLGRRSTRWVWSFGLGSCVALLTACGGGGNGGGDVDTGSSPLLPTISQDIVPTGNRIDVSSRDFFPMSAGDSWLYDRLDAGSVNGYVRRTVTGTPAPDGSLTVEEEDSTATEVVAESYRTTTEGVWLADPFEAKGVYPGVHAALPSLLEYPTPFYPVGGVRSVIRQGSIEADIDGDGKVDYYRAEITQVFRGFEPMSVMGIDTEVAHFSNTLVLTVRTTSDDGTRTITGTEEAHFGSAIGLVRSDRAAIDSKGAEVIRPYRLEVVRAAVSGRAYPSGLVWRDRVSSTPNSLFAIASSPTAAVSVGALGTIVTSDDGISWTARSSGVVFHLNGVATSGTTFVAVGDAGTIVTSSDLTTWTTRASGANSRLLAVAWTGSQFVAVGESGTVLTSPDGAAWSAQASGTSEHLRAVAARGGMIVAGGDAAALITSTDGMTWALRAFEGLTKGLIWSGTQFLAVGEFGSPGFGKTRATSFDGITWTKQEGGYGNEMLGAAWSGAEFVAVGTFGISVTSSDGVAWAAGGDFSFPGHLNGVTWFKDQFIAVGSGGTMVSARQPLSVNATLFDIESSGTQVLAVGALGAIRTSADGTSWVARVSGVNMHLHGVAAKGPRFVAVGDSGTILTSEDLGAWDARASGTPQRLRAVTWTGNQYIAVGDAGVILTSPEGLIWTSVSSGTTSDLYGVAGDHALIVAVGSNSALLSSNDGTAWTPRASVGGNILYDVVWSGTQFLVLGNNPNGLTPTLQTSFDAVTWTARTGAYGNAALGGTWSGRLFAAVGDSSTAQTSPDGISWISSATPLNTPTLYGVTWHIDRFLAAGQFGRIVTLR